MKKLFMTALIITTLSAQTVSINISGNTADYSNNPLESSIKVNQLVAGLWEYRSETTTDTNGDFSLTLDNVTSIESSNLLSFNYSLQGNVLTSPSKAEAEIIDYTILGEEASRIRIELSPGRNTIKNNLSNLSNGIYIRSIHLKEGIITQKIVKQGNTLNYGTAGINKLQINRSGKINLKKANSDSLYIMTIAEKAGFLSDTIITSVSKDNPQDILGLNHRLKIDENQYYIPMHVRNFLHENETNITIHIKNPTTGQKLTYTSDQNGKITINAPKNFGPQVEIWYTPDQEPDSNFINFQAIQDSIKFGKKNLYNAKLESNQIQNYIEANLDTLQQKINENNPLVYKILRRYSESNQQPGFNGTYDMNNGNHVSFLLNANVGFIRKFNANITDTLHVFISDYVHHNSQATNEIATEDDINWRDEWLQDYEQLWNYTNDGWKFMHMAIHKVTDLYNNQILNEHRAKYGNKNFILVNINDQSGPSNIMKFEDFTNEFMNGIIDFLNNGTTFFNYNAEFAGPFAIQEEQNSIFAWNPAATSNKTPPSDSTPYKGTKFNETGAKLLNFNANIDQNYKYPWQIYEPRTD